MTSNEVLSTLNLMVLFLLLLLGSAILYSKTKPKTPTKEKKDVYKQSNKVYIRKDFMEKSEYDFFQKIIGLEEPLNVKIVPQVYLGAVIKKISNDRYQSELNRTIDFGFFTEDYCKLLLAVELNGSSHQAPNRIYRDGQVKKYCDKAGINIMIFETSYKNDIETVQKRITQALYTIRKEQE